MKVILSDVRDWRDQTARTIEELAQLKGEVETHQDGFRCPNEVLAYIHFFIDLFGRYLGDFESLLTDLPRGVKNAHVQIVKQIYDSASHEERRCVRFKDEQFERLNDPALLWLLENIYIETRELLINYYDLSNLVPRLRTFIGTTTGTPGGSIRHRSFAVSEENDRAAPYKAKVDAPFPVKKTDLGRWIAGAALTERQSDCFSLKMEYELSVSEISRRLGISRSVVDKHVAAAKQKINRSRANDSSARRVASKRTPE
jgi:DNA-binding CsgD family transcriptional regulator